LRHHKDAVESLLNRFVAGVPGVAQAFVVGADGLLIASSAGVDRDRADTVAAIAANLHGLASRAAEFWLAGRPGVMVIEMGSGFLFLMGLADGSVVVGWADGSCDVGETGSELAALAEWLS
jgi:predicted regulator of Ras-like GTPase activity (Roadblock/LC7/MglB family)